MIAKIAGIGTDFQELHEERGYQEIGLRSTIT